MHVGGRSTDIDHDNIADARTGLIKPSGKEFDTRQDHVGRRATDHRREVRPLAQMLAADDVREEHLADRRSSAVRSEHADARNDVVGDDVGHARSRQDPCRTGVPVAGHHHRAGPRALGQRVRPCLDRRGVSTVRAAGEEHEIGLGLDQVGDPITPTRGEYADHLAAAGQGDPCGRPRR